MWGIPKETRGQGSGSGSFEEKKVMIWACLQKHNNTENTAMYYASVLLVLVCVRMDSCICEKVTHETCLHGKENVLFQDTFSWGNYMILDHNHGHRVSNKHDV